MTTETMDGVTVKTSYGLEVSRLFRVEITPAGEKLEVSEVLHESESAGCDSWLGWSAMLGEIRVSTDKLDQIAQWYFTAPDHRGVSAEMTPSRIGRSLRLSATFEHAGQSYTVTAMEMRPGVCPKCGGRH